MKKAIVVGSGAGGATVARELQGKYDVTVLDAGEAFTPFSLKLSTVEKIKKTGLMFDEREIRLLFPAMRIRKTPEKMVLVRGIGLGGTTTLATGNGLRMDGALSGMGINLDEEFDDLIREIPITTDHRRRWRSTTGRLFEICVEMQLNPLPMPKMGDNRKCINCGRCVLGCPEGAKWDSRRFLDIAIEHGARIVTNCKVESVCIEGRSAVGVKATRKWKSMFFPADLVVLAAGGLGTPVILQNSGIECEPRLFVDPVLCVATEWKNCFQNKEISMPFVVQRDGFILSPYFDYLSFFFRDDWKFRADDTLGMMIKIADSTCGSVSTDSVDKRLTEGDREKLREGVKICYEIFERLGANKANVVLGTLNAGHPGGMLPLAKEDANTFHPSRLPENLYVADATLFPSSLGNPPILTIMAMAKRVSKMCCTH